MNDMQGILYSLRSDPELGALVADRNTAAIPFGGRYRLIDFMLSSMTNAGVRDLGVVMDRDYQSLLDHLSGGREWDLARHTGGLRLLPPFGLPESKGRFGGCMEALRGVRSYIESIPHENIVLSAGDLAANIDLTAVRELHLASGAEMTAVCADGGPLYSHHRLVPDGDGFASRLLFSQSGPGEGLLSLEVYILKKSLLLSLMDYCASSGELHFHRSGVAHYLKTGGRIAVYRHEGYARRIRSALDYYEARMALLCPEAMDSLFPSGARRVRTRERAEASTYYSDTAEVENSLLADGCYIEGRVRGCVLFSGVRVEKGAELENCVVMHDCVIGRGAQLRCAVADKSCVVSEGVTLAGNERLPILIPKGARI